MIRTAQTTFADDTTLSRRDYEQHLPYVFVQATLACRADEAVVAALRTRARRPQGMFKWTDVRDFVMSPASEEAGRVRSRLAEATIMIVDPMAYLRTFDLDFASRPFPPVFSRQGNADPRIAPLRNMLTRQVGQILMIHSGAESVFSLIRAPLIGEGIFRATALRTGEDIGHLDPLRIARETKGLTKLSRIALQTTALVAHELDPETRTAIAPFVEGLRFGLDTAAYDQARLETLVRRSIVYDRGHEDATSIAAALHGAARTRAANCPIRWAAANDDVPTFGAVRTGATHEEAELQMADVAAGWASEILRTRGALALSKTFRFVVYNGVPLKQAQAERIDSERRFHDRLIERAS